MKDIVYIVVNRNKVDRMTKTLPNLYQNEHVIRLEVNVKDSAFNAPTLTQKIEVDDWREGIDISDVDFSEPYITEKEAELIRKQREERMIAMLKAKGYSIEKTDDQKVN